MSKSRKAMRIRVLIPGEPETMTNHRTARRALAALSRLDELVGSYGPDARAVVQVADLPDREAGWSEIGADTLMDWCRSEAAR